MFATRRRAALRIRVRAIRAQGFPLSLRKSLSRRARRKLEAVLTRRSNFKASIMSLRDNLRLMQRRVLDFGQRTYHSFMYGLTDKEELRAKRQARARLYRKF